MTTLIPTYRAYSDLDNIEANSRKKWGAKIADKYVADINRAFDLLKSNPGLLQTKENISSHLKFYPTNKHMLICDYTNNHITVLSIMHVSMDIPSKLGELEPTLIHEAKMMRDRLSKRKKV